MVLEFAMILQHQNAILAASKRLTKRRGLGLRPVLRAKRNKDASAEHELLGEELAQIAATLVDELLRDRSLEYPTRSKEAREPVGLARLHLGEHEPEGVAVRLKSGDLLHLSAVPMRFVQQIALKAEASRASLGDCVIFTI